MKCLFFSSGLLFFPYWFIGYAFWILGLCWLKMSFWWLVACVFISRRGGGSRGPPPLNSFAHCLGASGNLLSLHGQRLPFLTQLGIPGTTTRGPALPSRGKLPRKPGRPLWEWQCVCCAHRACFVFSSLLLSSISRENGVWALCQPRKLLLTHQCRKEQNRKGLHGRPISEALFTSLDFKSRTQ